MAYVNLSLIDKGTTINWVSKSFETMDDALDYYLDIDLRHEFEHECSWSKEHKVVVKELLDEHGTLDSYDSFSVDDYEGR